MSLLSLLLKSLTSQSSLNTLSGQTGASKDQINKLLILALPILLKYLTKNASTEGGALSLLGALNQHKEKAALSSQLAGADTEDGARILAHILGKKEESVTRDLAAETGLDEKMVLTLLASIAPALLSGISAATNSAAKKKKKGFDLSDGLDFTDIAALFGGIDDEKPNGRKSKNDGTALLGALLGLK